MCSLFYSTAKYSSRVTVTAIHTTAVLAGCLIGIAANAQESVSALKKAPGRIDLDLKPSYQLKAAPEPPAVESKARTPAQGAGVTLSRLQRATLASAVAKKEAEALVQGAPRLRLEDLIGLAIQAHPEVVAKRADLDAARAGQDAARWQYYPTPSLEARRLKKGEHVTVAAVQQPLWSGGRLEAGLEAANSRLRSADVAISEAQYVLALRLTGYWQSWLQARGRAEALAGGVALLEVYAESVRQRIKGGISPEVDRELVQSRLAQVQGDLAAARAAERSALSQISQVIGRPLRAEELHPAAKVTARLPAFELLLEHAVERSAALRRIEAEVEAARHDVDQKRAALWPTLAVRAEYQRSGVASLGEDPNQRRVMLVMDYVPGAGLSAGAGISAAQARVASLGESREAAKRELLGKISADYEDHLSSRGRKQDTLRTLAAATEVLASYDRLFIAGKRNWLDVLNAARELTQVQTSLADIEALLAASHYRLRLHSGELPWQQGAPS